MSLKVEEVENRVEQVALSGILVILQRLEIRPSLVIHHDDFAVQHSVKS